MYKNLLYFFTLIILVFSVQSYAQEHSHDTPKKEEIQLVKKNENHAIESTTHTSKHNAHGEPKSLKEQIESDIKHHLQDNHDFHVWKYISFPLPIILWDNGLHIFLSSRFHNESGVAESKGNYYAISHSNGHIYKTDQTGHIDYNEKGIETNERPFDISITKNVFMIMLTGILMLLLFTSLAKSYTKNGGIAKGIGRFFEPIVLYIRDDIAIPNIGERHYKKYMSYLLTIFFLIWFLNLFGLTPLGANITGNLAVTAALALITYVITTFTAKKDYWKHIFWMPGVPTLMKIILAPIELLGTFIKPFSLMIRLYANIMAGHVVMMTIIGLIFIFKNWIGSPLSFGLAFGISILELLVAALQAYIFTMLSALYFGAAKEEHEQH